MTVGTDRSEFAYDGLQRRVRQVEKDNGVTTADTRVLWCETAICEERAADGVTVTRRAFGLGEQIDSQARYFTTDHLGSVREVTAAAGTLLARYAFDPWGRRTVTAGSDVTTVGFTGHRTHTSSGLALTLYRGYDAGIGRLVSEDPLGDVDGPNRYAYAANAPTNAYDPLGLTAYRSRRPLRQREGLSRGQRATSLYHEYYCVSNGGVTRCCGQTMLRSDDRQPRRLRTRPSDTPGRGGRAGSRAVHGIPGFRLRGEVSTQELRRPETLVWLRRPGHELPATFGAVAVLTWPLYACPRQRRRVPGCVSSVASPWATTWRRHQGRRSSSPLSPPTPPATGLARS